MESKKIPTCIGVIMDGNRRWAKINNKISADGHRAGYQKLREFLEWSRERGVKTIIAYALSAENWNRSETELGCLMDIFRYALTNEIESLKRDRVALRFIGDLTKFPGEISKLMIEAERETANFTDFTLALAVSYGGRDDILHAVKMASSRGENLDKINAETFSKYLYTDGIAEPEMIVRTGGEMRMSNFLTWQSIYSELFFTKTLWPDFGKTEYVEMIEEYTRRKKNFGK